MASTTVTDVAATVRAELARKQITQRELGLHLHLSQPAISRRLSGEKAFDVSELSLIADLVRVPIGHLLA